jgi:hypothetical protein
LESLEFRPSFKDNNSSSFKQLGVNFPAEKLITKEKLLGGGKFKLTLFTPTIKTCNLIIKIWKEPFS